MDLLHLELETLDRRQHDTSPQAGTISRKQPIEGASEPVVADLALRDQSRIVECGPFPHRIERVALDHDVLDQGQQRIGIARVLQRQG